MRTHTKGWLVSWRKDIMPYFQRVAPPDLPENIDYITKHL